MLHETSCQRTACEMLGVQIMACHLRQFTLTSGSWRAQGGISRSIWDIFWLRFVHYFTSKGFLDR
jgi:hypothetical protein